MKASKRHYKSNLIRFKQEGSVVYSVGLIFGPFFFFFFVTAVTDRSLVKALIRHFGVARTGSRCLSSALWDVFGGRVFNSGE